MLSQAETHARTVYDMIVIPPFAYFDDQDPIRIKDINKRRSQHFLIIEYLRKNNLKIFEVPETCCSVRDMVQLIKIKFDKYHLREGTHE